MVELEFLLWFRKKRRVVQEVEGGFDDEFEFEEDGVRDDEEDEFLEDDFDMIDIILKKKRKRGKGVVIVVDGVGEEKVDLSNIDDGNEVVYQV